MPLKILCLHGFRHSADAINKSMAGLIKKFEKKGVEFVFYNSPIIYTGDDAKDCDYRQWWSATRENVLTLENFDTIEESIKNLSVKWESDNYDGILGFSQGSVLTQIFAYQIQKDIIKVTPPKFIILASPFPITDNVYKDYYKDQLCYKIAVMTGSRDTLVDTSTSLSLLKYFKDSTTITHSGGHYVSSSGETYNSLQKFLAPFI